jgi:predicted metal-dependent hydrolase
MLPERSHVTWGSTEIRYQIRRSARRGTVSIGIDPKDGVMIVAPNQTPIDRLDRVVRAKAPWIVRKLRRQSDLPPPPPSREFVSGETFAYLGRQYRLRVIGGEPRPLRLTRGRLEVSIPAGLDAEHHAAYVRAAMLDWYRRRAADRLRPLAATWSERMGVQLGRVHVRDQAKRWGSCDHAGNLRLNWRIVQAPKRLIEYVVAHEIVHVLHADHGRTFWAALGRVMPDYEARRDELRKIGPTFEW